jgi:dynein heavy chain
LIKKASVAAAGMADWARAIIQFHDALLVVKPRQAQLKEAKEASEAALASLNAAKAKLDEVQKALLAMVNELKAVREEEANLKKQKENCEFSLSVAQSLIVGLAEEKTAWEENEVIERKNDENLVGDIIICSGFIAYLGIFLNDYRAACKEQWIGMLKRFKIASNDDVSLESILGDSNTRLNWVIHGLPDDGFSVENAIIQENSERWTLMIDPQMQGNNWLRDTYGSVEDSQLQIIKPTTDAKIMQRKLDQALSYGYPVIFEDATETFDPMLEPIISRQIQKRGADYFITFNQQPVMYNTEFKFFITTKMAKPHYSPEMCVKVTMLNFMVTQEGL